MNQSHYCTVCIGGLIGHEFVVIRKHYFTLSLGESSSQCGVPHLVKICANMIRA